MVVHCSTHTTMHRDPAMPSPSSRVRCLPGSTSVPHSMGPTLLVLQTCLNPSSGPHHQFKLRFLAPYFPYSLSSKSFLLPSCPGNFPKTRDSRVHGNFEGLLIQLYLSFCRWQNKALNGAETHPTSHSQVVAEQGLELLGQCPVWCPLLSLFMDTWRLRAQSC